MSDFAPCEPTQLRRKYVRANALVANVLNKYYNGSARAVDPFVIRRLREEETRLFSIQCFLEEGPAETRREHKQSKVSTSVSKTPTFSHRVFVVCGGYLGGPGSVMRRWEELSDAGYDDAMLEYVALVDKIVPGWDHEPLEYPVAKQENFWKNDATALQCQYCGALFSLPIRRHHCRMCLDVFCSECCSESLEIALCPGAPLRLQRVCCQCFQEVERGKSMLEVRRVIRENHDLEQQIRKLQSATEAQLAIKQREEAKLRQEALASGCDMDALDASIHKRVGLNSIGSSSSESSCRAAVSSPPAHRFAPRETVEANDQLALANRQLLMGLKVAQCRGKKALEKIDATLVVLREAICFGSSNWNVVLRHARVYLTLRELKALAHTSQAHRAVVERARCERKCVLEQDVTPGLRPALWQSECLKDAKTQLYVSDLAEEIRALVDASDSDSDDSGDAQADASVLFGPPSTGHASSSMPWLLLLEPVARNGGSVQERIARASTVWERVYDIILARCRASPSALEFDAQIRGDVQRTFGVSALRRMKHKTYQKAAAPGTAPKPELPVELRRTALENVLRAFSSVNTEIGYCQGMDHVAAVLLSVVDWREPRAFWMLTSLVASPKFALDALYSPGLPHLNLRCYQLERLMKLHLPELSRHLGGMDFPVSMFATSWFMTLFTSMEALSYDAVLRVIDGFVVAGWKHIFRVALAILQLLQHHILASAFEEIPQIFYDIHEHAPQLAVASQVLARAAAFKVTNATLKRLESEYAASLSPPPSSGRKRDGKLGGAVAPASLSPRRHQVETKERARIASTSRRSQSFSSAPSTPPPPLANGSSHSTAKAPLATLPSTKDDGEKSPDSTREATPLRPSGIANTRLVV